MHAFITADELVGEGESGHEATLLEPEDRGKRSREEDTLDGGEGDETLAKGGLLIRDPSKSPVGLLLDAGNGLDSVEEELAASGVLDVRVDEERISLRVDILPVIGISIGG